MFKVRTPTFSTLRAWKRDEARERAALPSWSRESRPSSISRDEELLLDAQTLKDLEIFQSEKEGASLFDMCNSTRNAGGAKALRERMKRPWSAPARIRGVQDSLAFIQANRPSFERLPTFATTEIAENYLHGVLPLVTSINALEYSVGALELRLGDVRRYSRIQHGVDAAIKLIGALRGILFAPALSSPPGELGEILDEMRTLLGRPAFAGVRDQEAWDLGFWRLLRLDQVFRVHEPHSLARLLRLLYEVDALIAMADTCRKHDFLTPRIEDGPLSVHAEGLVHPFVSNAVPNAFTLNQDCRLLFLTGPNMAGKTTYLRACALGLYLAHLGMGVPAKEFRFVPAQRLLSSIALNDDIHEGVSFFHAEALRMKAIAQSVSEGHRVIALMDEPFKGTNVKDALDASAAILERLAGKDGCLFMFSSHLIELEDRMGAAGRIDCRHFEADEDGGRLRFRYQLRPGVSSQRLGMRVLREQGIFDLLDGKVI